MSDRLWTAVVIAMLWSPATRVTAAASGRAVARAPAEVCEAFPWDVPVEQSFSVESVLRWRRAMDRMRSPDQFPPRRRNP